MVADHPDRPPPPRPVDGFPWQALDRLKAVDEAFTAMESKERKAAFEWLRSKFANDFPPNPY